MKKNTGFIRLIKAAGYSKKGLIAAWKNEAAIRQELLALIPAVIIAFAFSFTAVERVLLIGSVVLVVVIELINSAIEAVVDRIGTEYHELSGQGQRYGVRRSIYRHITGAVCLDYAVYQLVPASLTDDFL